MTTGVLAWMLCGSWLPASCFLTNWTAWPRQDRVSHHHDVQVLSQLLVLLDGLEARGRIAIVATSNRLEAIDPALLRPGRFDYHIEVPVPDRKGRLAILQVCLAKMKTRGSLRMEALAEATAGYSGAELAALCREAVLQAIRRGLAHGLAAQHLFVSRQDLQQALFGAASQALFAHAPTRKSFPSLARNRLDFTGPDVSAVIDRVRSGDSQDLACVPPVW